MDIYKKNSSIIASDNLFKELKFFITGNISEWVIQLLINGGARQESHITDFTTHVVTGINPNENDIGEAKDIYEIPVVSQSWVIYSTKCEKLLPINGFNPEATQLFSGVKASLSKLGVEDSRNIWGLINFYGGKCTLDLDHKCTHLIIGKPEGIKYQRALAKPIEIVTPDWITDTINIGQRMEEILYHPRLLNHTPPTIHKKPAKVEQSKKSAILPVREFSTPKPVPASQKEIFPVTSKAIFSSEENIMTDVTKQSIQSESIEKSFFDSIIFSDDEDETSGSDNDKKNLLNQLQSINSQSKNIGLTPQLWKKSATPPITSKLGAIPVSSSGPELCSSTITQVMKPSITQPISIESSSKASLPPYPIVSIATPSISITPHSASSAILPQSLIGSYSSTSSSKQIIPTTTGSLRASQSNAPAIISTSEVDISYISKHAIQGTTSSSSILPQQMEARTPAVPVTVSMMTAAFSMPSTASVSKSDISHTGKPMSKLLGQVISPFSQPNRSVSSPSSFSELAASTPSFSSSQCGQSPLLRSMKCSSPQATIASTEGPFSTSLATLSTNNQQVAQGTNDFGQNILNSSTGTSQGSVSLSATVMKQAAPNQMMNNPANAVGGKVLPSQVQPSNTNTITTGPPTSATTSNQSMPFSHILNQGSVQFVRQGSSVSVVASQGPPSNSASVAPSPVSEVKSSLTPVGQQSYITKQSPMPGQQMSLQNVHSSVQGPNQSGVNMSNNSPNLVPQQQQQQHSHSVAIPGAVVRLPSGFTHQQLQMMSPEERHRFLDQLRKQQLQDQRGKPRPGTTTNALHYKTVVPGGNRYQNTVRTQITSASSIPQTSSSWPTVSTPLHSHPVAAAATQGTVYATPGGQLQAQASTVVGPRTGWHQTSQQQPFAQGQTRVVQQGWQQGQSPSLNTTAQTHQAAPPTQGMLPQQLQQLHVQQLRQRFPYLSQQEAQQLIQTIPGHLREIQSRDNAGRFEYLSKLDERESDVVNHFYLHRQHQQMLQRQMQAQQQQQQQTQMKIGAPQQSPTSWQVHEQFPPISPLPRPSRPLLQGYAGQTAVVSPGQGSPQMVQQQMASPLASPHDHSPQRPDASGVISHPVLQGSSVPQNLANQQNLVNPKTKTALANLLTNRLSGSVQQVGLLPQGSQVPIDVAAHVQKQGVPSDGVQTCAQGGDQLVIYQRRTLGNITGSVTNNIIRPPVSGSASPSSAYPRTGQLGQQPPASLTSATSHYARPHLFGHDINTMLPRELCMVGCIFYIADYYATIAPDTLNAWRIVIQQHGGEVVNLYETSRVTHVLCHHQKSPVFQRAVRDNKRCITIYWVNDILIRGKMAPPWQAIHLPTPFGNTDKPMTNLLVSVTGFENDERSTIKLMLKLAGAKYTGYFSKNNHLLVCRKFEGVKVNKAREWKKSVVNGSWLSEVLLGQNIPPLIYRGTKYQHFLDDPLRIDPSLASHLFNAWKFPISVSKESVEKAKSMREMALRKRKKENDGDKESKKIKLEPLLLLPEAIKSELVLESGSQSTFKQPKVLLSNVKNKEEVEKKIQFLGGMIARSNAEATHLIMGCDDSAPRTVKLLCAISCAKYVLSAQWLYHSYLQHKFLAEDKYSLRMPEFERVFAFNLKETMRKPNRKDLFAGKHFFLTPSVVPGRTWLREIIECAGGHVDSKRKTINEIKERNRDGRNQYICITTDDDCHMMKDLLQENMPVMNSEFVMVSIMKQEVDFNAEIFQIKPSVEE